MLNFKVGDWVTTPHRGTFRIEHEMELASWEITLGGQAKLWQPKLNEWCWFWNKNKGHPDFGPRLAQFMCKIEELQEPMDFPSFYSTKYKPLNYGYLYDYCEPFIGQLPTQIKG